MIAGQIASNDVVGVSYAEDIESLWGMRQRLCSMAAPENSRSGKIHPEACERCMGCGYGKQLLKLIREGKIRL